MILLECGKVVSDFSIFQQEAPWAEVAQGFMWSIMVIDSDPLICELAHFFEGSEPVGIEDLFAVAAVEAFDKSIL